MNHDEYRAVASIIRDHDSASMSTYLSTKPIFSRGYIGYVQPKERPRHGKNGHTFTPAKTKAFEASVREWFEEAPVKMVYHPVRMTIRMCDRFPPKMGDKTDRFLKNTGFSCSQVGDLDNKEKAISDALNNYLYADDKQISSVTKTRAYGTFDGFHLTVWRSGFSKFEIEQIKKFI